ncbi:hypothetical protein BC830DRAFT_1123970 [Chytriomyces sp. MP71]|nr:hypothetical protein BC830DRAFT_1123970 [Chytriomyces sp. MP71]
MNSKDDDYFKLADLPVRRTNTLDSIKEAVLGNSLPTNKNPALETIPVFRTLTREVREKGLSQGKEAKDIQDMDIHAISTTEALVRLGAVPISEGGLKDLVAVDRLKQNGPNKINPPKQNPILKILSFYFGGFCLLMWAAAFLIFLSYWPIPTLSPSYIGPAYYQTQPAWYSIGLVIMIVVVILAQGTFYAFQDYTSSSVMSKINNLLASEATVIRGGKSITIPAENVVVGDIVELRLGAKIPADVLVLECSSDLATDRSILTGESIAVNATNVCTDPSFMESKNVAFMGTTIVNGSGKAVVVATADNTIMGRIATLAGKKKAERTLLQIEIDYFIIFVATIALLCGATCMIVWKVQGEASQYDIVGMLGALCGIIVAFVPEGLPISVSATLTLIARRMAKQFVLVKNLTTVETLGSVSIICTDKTGTLTTNKMTLRDTSFAGVVGDIQTVNVKARTLFHAVASQCCGAEFKDDESVPINERAASGDATDVAVLRAAEALGPVAFIRNSFTKLFEIPFNSRNKWMMTIQTAPPGHASFPGTTLFIKGAPDVLFPKVTSALNSEGKIVDFDAATEARVIACQEKWASEGKRVLAFAYRAIDFPSQSDKLNKEERAIASVQDLVLVGLGAIVDPPRAETKPTVDKCRGAHIRVAMVTGDFALTAVAIAREVNIITASHVDTVTTMRQRSEADFPAYPLMKPSLTEKLAVKFSKKRPQAQRRAEINLIEEQGRAIAISGSEIANLTDSDWDRICLYQELVFARTSPEQKLKIVEEFKARGEIVAVTGDGVNDSPALKAANVGVAMGGGSEVAMEAASLVLIDNNFSSLISGIESGRLCFDNIKKVIMYLIPCGTFSELIPVLFSIFIGIQLPLNTAMDLVICCITDVFPSMAMIYESPESTLMTRPPRHPSKDRLVNVQMFAHVYLFVGMMQTTFAHTMYFSYWWRYAGVSFSDMLFMGSKLNNDPVVFPSGTTLPLADFTQYSYNAASCYFAALVIMQVFGNVYAVRTRYNSVLQQNPFWGPTRNLYIPMASVASICVALFFVYTPGLNTTFWTGAIPVEYWFMPIPCALFILIADELRKLAVRTWGHDSWIGKASW